MCVLLPCLVSHAPFLWGALPAAQPAAPLGPAPTLKQRRAGKPQGSCVAVVPGKWEFFSRTHQRTSQWGRCPASCRPERTGRSYPDPCHPRYPESGAPADRRRAAQVKQQRVMRFPQWKHVAAASQRMAHGLQQGVKTSRHEITPAHLDLGQIHEVLGHVDGDLVQERGGDVEVVLDVVEGGAGLQQKKEGGRWPWMARPGLLQVQPARECGSREQVCSSAVHSASLCQHASVGFLVFLSSLPYSGDIVLGRHDGVGSAGSALEALRRSQKAGASEARVSEEREKTMCLGAFPEPAMQAIIACQVDTNPIGTLSDQPAHRPLTQSLRQNTPGTARRPCRGRG